MAGFGSMALPNGFGYTGSPGFNFMMNLDENLLELKSCEKAHKKYKKCYDDARKDESASLFGKCSDEYSAQAEACGTFSL